LAHRKRRVKGCALRRLGDPRCTGPSAVLVADRYGTALWGCPRHAAQALHLLNGSKVIAARRGSALVEVQAWLTGDRL
jgi:hypothetical protein